MAMTDYCFFVHGTPSSKCSTSKARFGGLEEAIFGEFFRGENASSASSYLVYETRQWNEDVYSVYTYYERVSGSNGRAGCYCALTLIVKGLVCREVTKVYDLLYSMFANALQGYLGILGQGRFLVSTFNAELTGLDRMESEVDDFIHTIKFVPFNEKFHISDYNPSPECFNICDVCTDVFIQTLQNAGRVFISDSYETIKARTRRLEQERKASEHKNDSEVHSVNGTKDLGTNDTDNYVSSNADSDLLKPLEDMVRNLVHAIEQRTNGSLMNGILRFKPLEWLNLANFILLCICLFSMHGNFTRSSGESSEAKSPDSVMRRENSVIVTYTDSIKVLNDSIKVLNDSINANKKLLNK